ncbi:MAG: hypothetical protein MI743_21010 [Sneathiellales bacterium]|nr:hypothetical protein [Sneathiellales bacterium]
MTAAALMTTGCSGAHFYNAENHEVATVVKEASDNLKLVEVINQERVNQANLLNHELKVVADFATTKRNTVLRELFETGDPGNSQNYIPLSTKLNEKITVRIQELSNVTDLAEALIDLEREKEKLHNLGETIISSFNVSPPECSLDKSEPFKVTEDFVKNFATLSKIAGKNVSEQRTRDSLGEFAKRCTAVRKSFEKVTSGPGIIKTNSDIWKNDQELLDRLEKEASELKSKFANPNKDKSSGTAKKTKLSNLKDVSKLSSKAAVSTNAFLKNASISEQLKNIDILLQAASHGKLEDKSLETASDEIKKAATFVSLLPVFKNRSENIAALENAPSVHALLLEKERLLALKKNAEQSISRTKSRLRLLEQKQNMAFSEILLLTEAKSKIAVAIKEHENIPVTLADLYAPISEPKKLKSRREILAALAIYLSTYTGPRQTMHEIDYRLIDLEHARALDSSETALKLWETAIKQPIAVLADYHSSGVKPEDIFNLLQAAGLFFIGKGVN